MRNANVFSKDEQCGKSNKWYKEIMEILPKEKRWTDTLDLYQYQGFWYPYITLEEIMLAQEQFKAQSTDVVLCSHPKTGTTWLKALSFAIATRKRFGDVSTTSPLLTTLPHECIPCLELEIVRDGYVRDPQLPLLSTHVSYTSLPKSVLESGCKIVYVCRDPKDTLISLWHFLKKFVGNAGLKQKYCFETEFDRFCQGKAFYGPFWDHVLGFWHASLENPEKVLFLKYEDMKKDTLFYIRRLADFLNQPFSKEEENEGVPQKIMELCSFSNLSCLEVNKTGKYLIDAENSVENSSFYRKGEAGDWKNHLTREMMERIDAITEKKFDGSGLTFGESSSACY